MQRISKEEFNKLKGAARETYLREVDQAGADAAKLSLAERKLAWAEESAVDAFNQRSRAFRFFDGIPVLGKPIAVLIDHVENSVAEHGLFIGLLRGALMGLVIAATVLAAAEGVMLAQRILHSYLQVHVEAPITSGQRTQAVEDDVQSDLERLVHIGTTVSANQNVKYYVVKGVSPSSINDCADVTFEYVLHADSEVFDRATLVLDHRIKVSPFFRRFLERKSIIPLASKPAHNDVATVVNPETKAEYAMAALDEDFILIPIAEYKAAGLPIAEPIIPEPKRGPGAWQQRNAPPHHPSPVLDITHAVTVSNDVPFVGVFSASSYRTVFQDPDGLAHLKQMTTWFHYDGLSQPQKLPAGTYYRPWLKNTGDPNSILVTDGAFEKYILAAVKIKDSFHPEGDENYGLIPKAEYDAYVRGLK